MVEYLLHQTRKEQVNTFLTALEESIDGIVNKGDKIKIVAFALRNQDTDKKILVNITDDYSDNVTDIKNQILNFKNERKYFNFNDRPVSNIFSALEEGIDDISSFKTDFPKSILLLSDERVNQNDPLTQNSISDFARKKK